MKKMILTIFVLLFSLALFAGCSLNETGSTGGGSGDSGSSQNGGSGGSGSSQNGSSGSSGDSQNSQNNQSGTMNNINIPQTGWTTLVPNDYKTEASEKGSVVRLDYASKDYVRGGGNITKTAYVYTPYGYDEDADTRYNILYLMHGWGGRAGEYFDFTSTKNMFDHLIENGDIEPIIIVSATFYNENSSTDFSSSIREFREFHRDFEENLMPAVEGKYRTFAESTSSEDLKASRDHRAFGGFSLGSVTTWLQFCYDYDYIRYFLPMSGSCWYYGTYGDFQIENNVDFIEQLVKDNDLDERGYFIYHAVGTQDAVKSQSIDMAEEMLTRDIFTPQHYVFYQKDGGYHDFNAVQEYLYNALPLFFPKAAEPYTKNTNISDVINDPVFDGYGRLIFPVNSGYYSGSTLGDLRLTWYNYINADKTVEICNYMKAQASAGKQIFYDIYSDAEKAADPAKANTGLFFFRGNEGAKFAVTCAGGGWAYVGAMHDSFPHALELSKLGYNAFAIIYRPGEQTACEDLARALTFIFDHAEELGVETSGYSLWGGSAGGRMAARLGSRGAAAYGGDDLPKPATCVIQYTGYSDVKNDPPTYSCVGTSDGIANYRTMQKRIDDIKAAGTDAEIEVFQGLSHGFGLGQGTVAEGWLSRAVAFWERNMNNASPVSYTADTPIEDVMNDPVFGDYGRLIFPVNESHFSGETLGELEMTWYNYINADKTVEICNYLKSQAGEGKQIFYDIYSDAEKATDPAKANTGLFFFRGEKNAKFAVICAGGGWQYVGAMHDSFPHALELSKMGYNAFAIIYRPGERTACEDLARALTFIFDHAEELGVDTDDYSLWGGSAGAIMIGHVGSRGTEYYGECALPKPAAIIAQYGFTDTNNAPPTYACVGTSDNLVMYWLVQNIIDTIDNNGIPAEIEVFQGLPHGFGLGQGTVAEGWINRAVAFWEKQM